MNFIKLSLENANRIAGLLQEASCDYYNEGFIHSARVFAEFADLVNINIREAKKRAKKVNKAKAKTKS